MNTLGEQHKASRARIAKGEIKKPPVLAALHTKHNQPSKVDADKLLRESFAKVVKRAKIDFSSGVSANLYGDEFLDVCSYIPHAEACYSLLNYSITLSEQRGRDGNPDCLRLTPATPVTQEIVNNIWHPFPEWVKAQGLKIHMSQVGEAYGVRHFLVLSVWAVEEEVEAKIEELA